MRYLQTHVHIYLLTIKNVIILEKSVSHDSVMSAKEKENYSIKLKRRMIERSANAKLTQPYRMAL